MKCRKCPNIIPETSGPGRPAIYCSLECKRSAELEIRRANTHLAKLEAVLSRMRVQHSSGGNEFFTGFGRPTQAVMEAIEKEIELGESRLRVLLAEPDSDVA